MSRQTPEYTWRQRAGRGHCARRLRRRGFAALAAASIALALPLDLWAAPGGDRRSGGGSPDVQHAVQKLERARKKPSRSPSPLRELARELESTQKLLRAMVNASGRGGGEQEAEILEASVERLHTLLGEAQASAAKRPKTRRRLERLGNRLDELWQGVGAVLSAETAAERGQSGSQLLAELESRGGTRVAPIARPPEPTLRSIRADRTVSTGESTKAAKSGGARNEGAR